MITEQKLKELQYWPKATAGSLVLYERETFCGSTRGSKSWAVQFANGKIVTFADYPSISKLIKKHYPVPVGTPKTWKKVEDWEG